MCLVFLCDEKERELGRQQAPGSCPCCGGKVEAMDVDIKWTFCFLTICHNIKRRYSCTLCSKRLEMYN
ncbi:hypothetical protein K2173_024653 [Erythroxylum novogranatense]|uniref:Methionyl-tRNA synthetase n=1 Tax=Erythroxylum novogranatense TaxID=1862640 RepID=A0AAV8SVR9_9ROSI|nr:hypothetical protein K2173_024653 [Erythroxylum novogranatense]